MARPKIHKTDKERNIASNLSSKLSMRRRRARDKAQGTTVKQAPITSVEAIGRHNLASRKSWRKKRYGAPFNDSDFRRVRAITKGIKSGQIAPRVGAAMVMEMGARYGAKVSYKRIHKSFYDKFSVPKGWAGTWTQWFKGRDVDGRMLK